MIASKLECELITAGLGYRLMSVSHSKAADRSCLNEGRLDFLDSGDASLLIMI